MTYRPDTADERLIAAMRRHGRVGVSELSRLTGLSRGTVHSRLDRLEATGVITGHGPDLDPIAAGFAVQAFTTLAIAQGSYEDVLAGLLNIDEIIEVHTVTGSGDLLLRILARSNDHLHDVLQRVSHLDHVVRTETQLALASAVHRSAADLIAARVEGADRRGRGDLRP